ncbi:DUF423 domain-containing protein [Anabaena sp. CS-542/02]|uniref:DUF423 domain-containing protein n=1 Tax=Anabaena sp. CS-542/02 TaxID=3021719 RepID=UPI00232F31B5|nr:DUF423 domain-containing protein [Anabaena sp. CS-542/02]MDB9447317.1 DUF423 domain-containing protein [Anabaena sp. CS-542/02]
MAQVFVSLAAVLGGLSVAAGAFAAHALRGKIGERSLEIFDTAARYQMYHALALLLIALLISRTASPQPMLVASGWLFIIGIGIFSGSLYALSVTGLNKLGAITPLGGVALIIGWGILAVAGWGLKF